MKKMMMKTVSCVSLIGMLGVLALPVSAGKTEVANFLKDLGSQRNIGDTDKESLRLFVESQPDSFLKNAEEVSKLLGVVGNPALRAKIIAASDGVGKPKKFYEDLTKDWAQRGLDLEKASKQLAAEIENGRKKDLQVTELNVKEKALVRKLEEQNTAYEQSKSELQDRTATLEKAQILLSEETRNHKTALVALTEKLEAALGENKELKESLRVTEDLVNHLLAGQVARIEEVEKNLEPMFREGCEGLAATLAVLNVNGSA